MFNVMSTNQRHISLLREIQADAIDSTVQLATLLRKCKVLAARLGNAEFKQWIDNELNGYETKEDLPPYRILHVNSQGNFRGSFQSWLKNVDIPLSYLPKEFRERVSRSYLRQSISALETLAAEAAGGTLQEPWNPDLLVRIGDEIIEDMSRWQAWKVIPATGIIAVLDNVRNRVLNFALEIEAEAPDAGEAPINSSPVPQEKVHQIFNTKIYGNVQNLATASNNVEQHAIWNEQNEQLFKDIIEALSQSGADAKAVARLSRAVEQMRDAKSSNSFKESYKGFMSILADHIQVLGPVLAPYLPALSALLP
jgi:hypothetical protein